MKKFFLDPKYRKFRIRLTFGISIVATILSTIITFAIMGNEEGALFGTVLPAPIVWLSYAIIVWTLKALPDDNDKR